MSQAVVLLIADDIDAAQLMATILRYRSVESHIIRFGPHPNGIKFPRRYDLVLLDSYYCSEDALSLIRKIRGECTKPLILLTYESDVRYHLEAYAAGVDECVTKPLGPTLFLAKVMVWLRQAAMSPHEAAPVCSDCGKIAKDGFIWDPKSHQVSTQDGHIVKLSALESRLMQLLLANQGHTLETNQLLNSVWQNCDDVDSRLLTNLVYRLRRKLASVTVKADHIKTVDRIGYMYE
jgi:two-component system response regulator ResD